jgi:hypothetical protein
MVYVARRRNVTPTPKQGESRRPLERILEGLSEKNRNFERMREAANLASAKGSL